MSRIDPRQCPLCGGVGEHGTLPTGGDCVKYVFPSEAAQRVRKALHDAKLAVHHIDGDPTNNSPENLTFVRWGENSRKLADPSQ